MQTSAESDKDVCLWFPIVCGQVAIFQPCNLFLSKRDLFYSFFLYLVRFGWNIWGSAYCVWGNGGAGMVLKDADSFSTFVCLQGLWCQPCVYRCSLYWFTPTKNIAHNPGEAGKADHNEDTGALSVFSPLPHLGQGISSLLLSVVDVLWNSNVVSFGVKI